MQPTPFGQVPAALPPGHAYHQLPTQQQQQYQQRRQQQQQQQPHSINSSHPSRSGDHRLNLNQTTSTSPSGRRRLGGARYTNVRAASNMNHQSRHGESWVEVSSQPSDSYSSSSNEDAIITEGLQLPPNHQAVAAKVRRRRNTPRSQYRAGGSENEYYDDDDDEDEELELGSTGSSIADFAESVTTSSVESNDEGEDDDYDDDEDEEDEEEEEQIVPVTGNLISTPAAATRQAPASHRFLRQPPQPDHDAALRASLSTLLSCAAAARGLSKPDQQGGSPGTKASTPPPPVRRGTGVHMETLTLMPNSQREAMLQNNTTQGTRARRTSDTKVQQPGSPRSRKSSVSHQVPSEVRKTQRTNGKNRHNGRRSRAASQVSPAYTLTAANFTYVTLAVSAGALILVSAISFSAGYMLGKEVGKEMALQDGGEIIKQATLGRTSGRIMSRGVGSSLRSITVV